MKNFLLGIVLALGIATPVLAAEQPSHPVAHPAMQVAANPCHAKMAANPCRAKMAKMNPCKAKKMAKGKKWAKATHRMAHGMHSYKGRYHGRHAKMNPCHGKEMAKKPKMNPCHPKN